MGPNLASPLAKSLFLLHSYEQRIYYLLIMDALSSSQTLGHLRALKFVGIRVFRCCENMDFACRQTLT